MNELCVSCHYARMRDDVCGIYCTGGFVENNGKCKHYKDCEEEWGETGLTREEVVTALRCCDGGEYDECNKCPLRDGINCRNLLALAAADLIENQKREIEALRWADNPTVPFGDTSPYTGEARADRVVRPYEATAEKMDVGGGVPDAPKDDEICRAALETFGEDSQVMIAIEEMSELTKELCKNGRGQENTTHIAEEIADVEIMLCQMKMLFDCAGQVETFRRYKLERMAGRIEEAREEKHGTTD